MSQHSYVQHQLINCPHCQSGFDAQIWLIVNTFEQPDLVERLEVGSLHRLDCPHCGATVQEVDAPLLLYRPGEEPPLLFSTAQQTTGKQNQESKELLVWLLQDRLGTEWQDSWLEILVPVPRQLLPMVLVEGLEALEKQARTQEQTYLQIIQQLLQAKLSGNEEQVYQVIAQYRDYFDSTLISVFEGRFTTVLTNLEPSAQNALAALLGDVCITILQSPLGCREYEIKFAIAVYHQAAEIRNRLGLEKDLSDTLTNLGNAYLTLAQIGVDGERNLGEAIAIYHQAAEICNRLGLDKNLSDTLTNLGVAYRNLAQIGVDGERNLGEAIAIYHQAAEISNCLGLDKDLSSTLTHLGIAYSILAQIGVDGERNLREAIAVYHQAAEIRNRLGLEKDLSSTLNNLGIAYSTLALIGVDGERNLREAIAIYHQAAEIRNRLGLEKDLSSTLNNLGIAYGTLAQIGVDGERNLREAIAVYHQAAEIRNRLGLEKDLSSTLTNLGIAYQTLAEIGVEKETNQQKAIDYYRQALEYFKPKLLPVDCHRAGRNLGNLAFKLGQWQVALEGYEPAIESVEQTRTWATTDKGRQEILEAAIDIYNKALQCYINLGLYQEAILLTERARSRHLVELMYSNDLYQGGDIPEDIREYLEQYEAIQKQINQEQFNQQSDDANKPVVTEKRLIRSNKSFEETKVILEELYKQKEQIWLEIRKKDKVLADRLEVPPINFETLKELIVDSPKTALLSFYSTNEHTYIFVLRRSQNSGNQLEQMSLPSGSKISLLLHKCENAGYGDLQIFLRDQWLIPYYKDNDNWNQKMGATLQEVANKLCLNDLIKNCLQEIEELILIPHILLHLLPFAALPVDPSLNSRNGYFGDLFCLRVVPSAQILGYCHDREVKDPYPALAGSKYATIEDATNDLVMAAYECEQIAKFLGIPEPQRLKGKQQATVDNYRQLTKNSQLRGLHSSHHAGSNLSSPLESALQLGDGHLTLGQLMSPGWRMPHLVEIFLSCCETNLGSPNITDDILTLAAGFLCAGARSVISTLWSVNALATTFFCLFYYQYRQAGEDRAKALQLAQQDLRNKTVKDLLPDLKAMRKYVQLLIAQTTEQVEVYPDDQEISTYYLNLDRSLKQIDHFKSKTLDTQIFNSPFYWAGFISQGVR